VRVGYTVRLVELIREARGAVMEDSPIIIIAIIAAVVAGVAAALFVVLGLFGLGGTLDLFAA
jgi:capsular polysaccharide biosynthesis protein